MNSTSKNNIISDNCINECNECDKKKKFNNCCIEFKFKKIIEITDLRCEIHILKNKLFEYKNKLFEYKNNYTNVNLINIKLKIEYKMFTN